MQIINHVQAELQTRSVCMCKLLKLVMVTLVCFESIVMLRVFVPSGGVRRLLEGLGVDEMGGVPSQVEGASHSHWWCCHMWVKSMLIRVTLL